MIPVPSGVRVWLAVGRTDMRNYAERTIMSNPRHEDSSCRHERAVARHIVALSTYLGHGHVTDTCWYLQATPILMQRIAEAGEAFHCGGAS